MIDKSSGDRTPLIRRNKTVQKETNRTHQCVWWIPHPRNEMDEGTPMLLQGHTIGILAVGETPYRRKRGMYPSTSPQTPVCLALVFGGGSSQYPPAPTSMNIGYWLCQTKKKDIRQFWIEAYACALQRVAEASVGRRWIPHKGIRVPKISRVVEVFLHATGTHVPSDIIRQCWPAW